MTRWICSALCTLVCVAVCFCLPVWHIQKRAAEKSVTMGEDGAVSVVSVVKKRPPVPFVPAASVPATAPVPSVPSVPATPTPAAPVAPKKEEPKKAEKTIPKPSAEPVAEPALSADDATVTPESNISESVPDAATATSESVPDAESGIADGASAITESGYATSESVSDATAAVQVNEDEKKTAEAYKKYALTRIAAKKTYPYEARSKGLEGKVRIKVIIALDGTLLEATIEKPCEHEILNTAALAAVKKAAPFKKMKGISQEMTLSFVMDFSLS